MNTFGTIESKDHTIEKFYVNAPISWELTSSSLGCTIVNPTGLDGAVTIERATNSETFNIDLNQSPINESGTYEYVLYKSIKNLFYTNELFPTSGLAQLTDNSYVVSIGQQFYGDRIYPTSFTLKVDSLINSVYDDGSSNLLVSESAGLFYVGKIFYDKGIAVLNLDTSASGAQVSGSGIKIVNGTSVYIDYTSDTEIMKHQINVNVKPTDFNFALLNPSMERGFTPTGSYTESIAQFTASMQQKGIEPVSGSSWSLFRLMQADVIKPYVTSIGLYNDRYELVAVAKLSTPIQRTFEAPQIFIVKFDT
jgi:hypothetical protein